MTATLATFASLLQRFYKGPVVDQLNNEIFILKYFMKQKFGWQGESVILPVRIGRNTGVGTRGEAQALPVAARQLRVHLRPLRGHWAAHGVCRQGWLPRLRRCHD